MADVTSSSLINLIRVVDDKSSNLSPASSIREGDDDLMKNESSSSLRNNKNLKIFEIRLGENNTSENDVGEEDETFNDAEEEPFARDDDDDDDQEENDKENTDRNRLLSIKSISSQQLNSGGVNFLHIKRVSVSKCGGASSEEDYLSIPNNNTSTSKTNTSSTTATSSENNNNNNSSSIYLNDLKHKLVNSYYTLSRSRSSSVSSTLSTHSSSSNSSRSASPTSNDASSLFGSNLKHTKKKPGRKKLKLSNVNAATLSANITPQPAVLAPINNFPASASLSQPSQPVTKTSQFSGVAKKVASSFAAAKAASSASSTRYNRFTKLRKTLNRGNKHEETRLSRKYAAAAAATTVATTGSTFSIGTACSSIASHHPYHSRQNRKLKCLLVGDAYVGKSTLMCLFLKKIFQTDYQPTIVDDFEAKVNMNGESYTLNLFDTAGQEDWETLRVMAYPESDVIILCFSVVRPDSLENILSKWIVELNLYIPNVLIVLVGTQVDLRDTARVNLEPSDSNFKQRHVSTKEGEEMCKRIKAYRYIECSALTQLNVNEVFNSCIDAYNSGIKKAQHSSSCFQILFRTFTNSLRRFRFYSKTKSSTSTTDTNANTTNKTAKYSKSSSLRKYLHES